MTQANFGFAFFVLLIVGGFTVYVWFGPYRRERLKHQRYRLFAVRDEWAYLVPSRIIQSNDPLFKDYFNFITAMLQATNQLTLRQLVNAFEKAELTPEYEELKRQMEELARRSPAALNVMEHFYQAVFTIIWENSLTLRIVVRLHKFIKHFNTLGSVIRRWCAASTQIKAYDSMQYCQAAVAAVVAARSSVIPSSYPWAI